MKEINPKTIVVMLIAVLIIIFAIFYSRKTPVSQQVNVYKCPEAYTEDDVGMAEYKDALIKWTSGFFETNPKATVSDWSVAKSKLWEDNNCIIAIQRSKMSGEVANLKPWELVDYEVQNTLDKAINNTN